jgi:hypothetical protein
MRGGGSVGRRLLIVTRKSIWNECTNSIILLIVDTVCVGHHHTQDRRQRQTKQKSQHNVLDTTAAKQTQHYVLDTTAAKQTLLK